MQMWMAESLMKTKDARHTCVQFLENQNLFQVQPTENAIAVRDALCDMEIYIGETIVEKCVFMEGQMFQQFPDEDSWLQEIIIYG